MRSKEVTTGPTRGHWYSDTNLEAIPAALNLPDVDIAKVMKFRPKFEGAASWLCSMSGYRDRLPDKNLPARLSTIANKADLVVKHDCAAIMHSGSRLPANIEISLPSLSRFQPKRLQNAILNLLALLSIDEDTQEDSIADPKLEDALMARSDDEFVLRDVMRTILLGTKDLEDLSEKDLQAVVRAAKELSTLARKGIAVIKKVQSNTVRPGHSGDAAINGWIDDMLNLYQNITGRAVGVSVGATDRKNEGIPDGPLIRFLTAAGRPVGLSFTAAGWESRIRTAQKSYAQK